MTLKRDDAARVAAALRAYEVRIDEIVSRIASKSIGSDAMVKHVQHLLTELKRDIKEAAARGKVEDDYLPQTECERMYFVNGMRDAANGLKIKPNSHPINSRWAVCLGSVQRDISYQVWRIQQQFPGI